ncbi:MAG: hypothetical protein DMF64_07285 [Acidobacteria bacterium]|nr:MAG: hypothetical protein DMF64_07285 [Acidobacteriota bacterium]
MVAKKITGPKEQKKGKVKVGKLKLNKETIKDLTGNEARRIKGGVAIPYEDAKQSRQSCPGDTNKLCGCK